MNYQFLISKATYVSKLSGGEIAGLGPEVAIKAELTGKPDVGRDFMAWHDRR